MQCRAIIRDAANQPGGLGSKAARFGENVARGFVPYSAALGRAAQVADPTVRDPRNLVDYLKSGIPGLSTQVPAKLDAQGRPITRDMGPPDLVNPLRHRAVATLSPAEQELERLGTGYGRAASTMQGVTLTGDQPARYR